MANKGPFPTIFSDLDAYFRIVVPYLSTNATRLGVSTGDISAIAALLVLWNGVYTLSENPSTATVLNKLQRDSYARQLEDKLRLIFHDIPDSVLTLEDRTTLHLPEHDATHTAAAKPGMAPVVTVDKIHHLQHILRFQNPETPESRAKPAGVATVEIYAFATSSTVMPPMPGPGPSGSNFHHVAGTGKFLYTVDFDLDDVGKLVFYLARYRNSRGEVGPWSAMISAVVA